MHGRPSAPLSGPLVASQAENALDRVADTPCCGPGQTAAWPRVRAAELLSLVPASLQPSSQGAAQPRPRQLFHEGYGHSSGCASPVPPLAPPLPPVCSLSVSSSAALPSGGATSCVGTFINSGMMQFDRPVYQHQRNGYWLYHWDAGSWAGWLCSSDHQQGSSFIFSDSRCTLPERRSPHAQRRGGHGTARSGSTQQATW
eukprot:1946831-Prymnesium_polylepis.1